jgi:hypothetical protein
MTSIDVRNRVAAVRMSDGGDGRHPDGVDRRTARDGAVTALGPGGGEWSSHAFGLDTPGYYDGPASEDAPLSWAFRLERMTGIEPAYSAWEADVLPLNYIRSELLASVAVHAESLSTPLA